MKEYFVNVDGNVCVVGLYFVAGQRYEPPEKNGCAHLTEHCVYQRCGRYTKKELYSSLNSMGATLYGTTFHSLMSFVMEVDSSQVVDAVKILAEIMGDYAWSVDEVNSEKRIVLRQIRESEGYSFYAETDKKYYSQMNMRNPIMGDYESVQLITSSDVNEYKLNMMNSSLAALVVTGNYSDSDKVAIRETLKAFGDERKIPLSLSIPRNFGKRTEEDCMLKQTYSRICDVVIDFDAPNEFDIWKLQLLNDILFVGDGAIMPWELKEERGLIGDLFSDLDIYSNFGRLRISFSVDAEELLESIKVLFSALAEATRFSNIELLESVKSFYRANTYSRNLKSYNYNVAEQGFLRDEPYDCHHIERLVNSVEVEDIGIWGKRLFDSNNLSVYITYNNKVASRKDLRRIIEKFRLELSN